MSREGRWSAAFEAAVGDALTGARSVDALLTRHGEVAVMEIFDWFEDVGAAARGSDRKLARIEANTIARARPSDGIPAFRVSGCWVVRATRRNRALVREHGDVFRSRFPGSPVQWLRALQTEQTPMPGEPALLWVSVDGTRLWAARP